MSHVYVALGHSGFNYVVDCNPQIHKEHVKLISQRHSDDELHQKDQQAISSSDDTTDRTHSQDFLNKTRSPSQVLMLSLTARKSLFPDGNLTIS